MRWCGGVLLGLVIVLGPIGAQAKEIELRVPNVYLSPTVGAWRWDNAALLDASYDQTFTLVYGLRVGYMPIQALGIEVVGLTGTNQVRDADPGTEETRLTQVELSGVVNFRGLAVENVYPIVALGLGYSIRDGDSTIDGRPVTTDNHINFHLGIGFKIDVSTAASVRFNFRDTFYTISKSSGGVEQNETVDSVELTVGLDYRFPMGRERDTERLR